MNSPLEVVLPLEQVLLASFFPAEEVVPPVGEMPPLEVAPVFVFKSVHREQIACLLLGGRCSGLRKTTQ